MEWTPPGSIVACHTRHHIARKGGAPMSITIAVDVAKSIFEVAVSDRPGRVVKRSRLSRTQFARLLVMHPPATGLVEACGSAHFWGRHPSSHGHRVVLLRPHAVR